MYHETSLPPYENFTVTVPASAAKGNGQINVAHAALIGVSYPSLSLLLNPEDTDCATAGRSSGLLGVSQPDCGRCINAASGMRTGTWTSPGS